MEIFGLILTTVIVFSLVLVVVCRLIYIRGYKSGARRVVKEWKESLNEEEYNNEQIQ